MLFPRLAIAQLSRLQQGTGTKVTTLIQQRYHHVSALGSRLALYHSAGFHTSKIPRTVGSKDILSGPLSLPSTASGESRLFHSTIPKGFTTEDEAEDSNSEKEKLGPQDKRVRDLMRQRYVKFQELDLALTAKEKETDTPLHVASFHHLVERCVKMKSAKGAEAAENLVFHWLIQFQGRLERPLYPHIFGLALQAWMASGHPTSGKRVEQLIDKLELMAREGTIPFPLNAIMYNIGIQTYSLNGDFEGAKAMFDRCMEEFKQGNEEARPNASSWASLIDAHANSKSPDAWKLAEEVFEEAKKCQEEGTLEKRFDSQIYNAIIGACIKSNQLERAEYWLEDLLKEHESGDYRPVWAFNAIIGAWARSEDTEGADNSKRLLDRMVELAKTGNGKPNTVSYGSVMFAYAKRGCPREAQQVFDQQCSDFISGNEFAKANLRSVSSILVGWSNAKEAISGEQAELVLDKAIELKKEGILTEEPRNVTIYAHIIDIWGQLANVEKATQVFERMLDDYRKGNESAKPNNSVFSLLMQAYSNAKLPDAGEKADGLTKQMDADFELMPGTGCIGAAIGCWEVMLERGHPGTKERLGELQVMLEAVKNTPKPNRKNSPIPVRNRSRSPAAAAGGRARSTTSSTPSTGTAAKARKPAHKPNRKQAQKPNRKNNKPKKVERLSGGSAGNGGIDSKRKQLIAAKKNQMETINFLESRKDASAAHLKAYNEAFEKFASINTRIDQLDEEEMK